MPMVAPDPVLGRRGPRIIPTGLGGGAATPGGGMTLDALMQRQAALQKQQVPMTDMQSPMQGVAYAAQSLMHGLQEGRAERQATDARGALAQAMAQIDPNTGELPPEAKATVAALDPDAYLQLTRDAVTAAREQRRDVTKHGWDVEEETQREQAASELAAQGQRATAEQGDLNRQADIKRAEIQAAEQRGDRAAATQAGQELAVLQGKIQATAAETKISTDKTAADEAAQRDVNKISQSVEARRAEGEKLGLQGDDLARYAATSTMPTPIDQFGPVPPEVAAKQGGDVARNPSGYKYNAKTGDIEPVAKASSPGDVKATQDLKGKLIETRGGLKTLQRAMDLAPNVFEGVKAKERANAIVATRGVGVSPEIYQQAKDTQEYFRIMDLNAVTQMSQTLSGSDSDRDVARFMAILSDPYTPVDRKKSQIQALIDKGRSYEQIQADSIRQTGGDPDAIGGGGGSDPQEGATATDANGRKVVLRNGQWVPM